MREGRVEQHDESFWWSVDLFSLWLDRGTSLDGLISKKLTGFSDTIIFSVGMTGKSKTQVSCG
jgi:hypothetical protein